MDSRNSIKKYGVCLNEKCEHYKVPQEIVHGKMECECGKKLSPCAPPKKKGSKMPLYIGTGAVVLIAIVVGCIFGLRGGSDKQGLPIELSATDSMAIQDSIKAIDPVKVDTLLITKSDTVVVRDTILQTDTVTVSEKEVVPVQKEEVAPSPTSGTLRLSYGTYTGAMKDGYPHGQGKLTYTKSRQINRNDPKSRTANAGEYVIGEFFNGFVVYGKHYDASGNLLGSLNFGVGSESSYESK